MDDRFQHSTYLIRKKMLKLFGGAFHIFGPGGELLFFSKMKAFKLKEDIRIYTDEQMTTEVLTIGARRAIDFSATYDVHDAQSGEQVGLLKRRGLKSILRDTWLIMDENEREIGTIEEDSMFAALIRRFITTLIPQAYKVTVDGTQVATFRQHFNPFILKLELDFSADSNGRLDRRLGIAAGILMTAIEGRQEG